MGTNILSIGQSALTAAQVGISVTGHNIANAATPGYNRQVVVQGSALAQDFGAGFLGQGTQIETVRRVYNEFLGVQVQSAQASKSGLETYYAQMRQIDNLLADPDAGLSPVMQDFFASLHEVSADPSSIPARQSVLSTAEALAGRFQGMGARLREIEQGVNSQITTSVTLINSYGEQIAQLNDAIGRAQRSTGQPPNDLLDQRDQLVLDLNKEIKATVVKQDDGAYNIFIGNGQPLVMGNKASQLVATSAPTNPEKIEIGYKTQSGGIVPVGDAGFSGGRLGGLLEFRSKSLEPAQNALGRIGITLASEFNTQHAAGVDRNGTAGAAFFNVAPPVVNAHAANTGSGVVGATLADAGQLTTSDYMLRYDGTQYSLTRLSDNTTFSPVANGDVVDGVQLSMAGAPAAGDSFLIRPTVNGATAFSTLITDPAKLAAAGSTAAGDNSNVLALAGLQTRNLVAGDTTSFQGAYGQLVSQVGNKTRELEVTSVAAGGLLTEATQTLQSESGVNLDEEATNLLRYQQAYQAAAKVMDIASKLFDTLLSLGR
ncbi:MAG: flagellar hook-associated protein FlgK [Thiobacillus sp. 65-29]|nr:MAG: flagellar hook-associated protein FlgK [Thiobacillus sp. 65-29]